MLKKFFIENLILCAVHRSREKNIKKESRNKQSIINKKKLKRSHNLSFMNQIKQNPTFLSGTINRRICKKSVKFFSQGQYTCPGDIFTSVTSFNCISWQLIHNKLHMDSSIKQFKPLCLLERFLLWNWSISHLVQRRSP